MDTSGYVYWECIVDTVLHVKMRILDHRRVYHIVVV
jgi:hypothetical protein